MRIIFEDDYILAVEKPVGFNSLPAPGQTKDDCLTALIKANPGLSLFPLHRLDAPVGGVLIFAKSSEAAAKLNKEIADGTFKKTYLAVTDGVPSESEGEYRDLLFKDSSKNRSYVVKRARHGVREAILTYKVIAGNSVHALVKVSLVTGRTHQIRVQFASRKTPLTGDGKYGSREKTGGVALWSHEIEFFHPATKEQITLFSKPDFSVFPWSLFNTQA